MGFWSMLFGKNSSNTNISNSVVPGNTSSATPANPNGANWLKNIASKTADKTILTVYDVQGAPFEIYSVDQKAAGGEGTVYEFRQDPNFIIKIYKDSIINNPSKTDDLKQRIIAMFQKKQCQKMDFIAWPLMPVFNKNRQIIGFVMRKVHGVSMRSLFGTKNIQKHFPGWDRLNLIEVAIDFVKKVKLLQKYGVQINDFNPDNFLIDRNGKVQFIDCDSFQITDQNNKVHITRTFYPSHCAPELLNNKSALAHPRNEHHLEFGTAIIIFNILMCGLHPYSYYDARSNDYCGSPDENLKKGRCPLGIGAGCRFPIGNWYNLWSWLTCKAKNGFIQTFRDGHSNPASRTSLEEWGRILNMLRYEAINTVERRQLNPVMSQPRQEKSANCNIPVQNFRIF